jgi:dTDP-4-dehydrorhamnose 3,5-epimerase
VLYKTTNPYYQEGERAIVWNDPTLKIEWPLDILNGTPLQVNTKDAKGSLFLNAELP